MRGGEARREAGGWSCLGRWLGEHRINAPFARAVRHTDAALFHILIVPAPRFASKADSNPYMLAPAPEGEAAAAAASPMAREQLLDR